VVLHHETTVQRVSFTTAHASRQVALRSSGNADRQTHSPGLKARTAALAGYATGTIAKAALRETDPFSP